MRGSEKFNLDDFLKLVAGRWKGPVKDAQSFFRDSEVFRKKVADYNVRTKQLDADIAGFNLRVKPGMEANVMARGEALQERQNMLRSEARDLEAEQKRLKASEEKARSVV